MRTKRLQWRVDFDASPHPLLMRLKNGSKDPTTADRRRQLIPENFQLQIAAVS